MTQQILENIRILFMKVFIVAMLPKYTAFDINQVNEPWMVRDLFPLQWRNFRIFGKNSTFFELHKILMQSFFYFVAGSKRHNDFSRIYQVEIII